MKQALINGAKNDEWYTPIETVKTMLNVFPPKKLSMNIKGELINECKGRHGER